MKIQNTFLSGIAGLMLAAGAANAQTADAKTPSAHEEEDEAILFKVHDVKPIRNSKGDEVNACDFYVTFYNRSNKDINGAQLDLTWVDNSLIDVVNAEKEESAEKHKNGEDIDADFSYTQNGNPLQLTASINMPAIKAYKQITVRQSLKTDRCYILLDDLSINVKSCAIKQTGNASFNSGDTCNGLFRFISQENPEYYTDFKPISYMTQRNSDIKERASQEKEMEEQYKKAVKSMDALTQTLAEIK